MTGKGPVSYGLSQTAWGEYSAFLEELATRPGVRKICEIGGGANPSLSLAFIAKHNLEYTILDISENELAKAPDGYIKLVGDITDPNTQLQKNNWDLIFSKMLAEHVQDGTSFHGNIFNLLAPGGTAFHFFPTLCSMPFVINKLLCKKNSARLLYLFYKDRDYDGKHGKFPAYYSLCYGPTKKQIKRLANIGYSIKNYIGFFGHSYFERIPLLHKLHRALTKLLISFPIPWLSSYAYVVLSKPQKA